MTFGRLTWSAQEFIELNLSSDYKFDYESLVNIKSELLSSFDQWKKISLMGRFVDPSIIYFLLLFLDFRRGLFKNFGVLEKFFQY